jgi:hypothetical protein
MIRYAYTADFALYYKAAREKQSDKGQHTSSRLSENHKDRLYGSSSVKSRRTALVSAIDAVKKKFKGTLVTSTIAAEYNVSDIFNAAG